MSQYENELRKILTDLNVYNKVSLLKPQDDLFALGALDSLVLIQYVLAIETHFNIRFPNESITYDNFVSLDKIEDLIQEIKKNKSNASSQ